MPFVYDPNLDEQQKQDQSAQSVQISGASPTVNSGGTTGQKSGPEAAPNTGSGFQNLDKYLQTNSSANLGSQVAGNVQGKIDTAKQNFDTAGSSFTQKVNTANNLPNQSDVNSAIANPQNYDPTTFQNWENQSYSGPHSLAEDQEDYNKYWSGTNQAKTEAGLLGTEPGRFSLLDTYFGRPNYSFGQKSLDNLLIQQEPGMGAKTSDLQNQAAQLQTQGTQQAQNLQDLASQRAGQVEQSRQMVRNAIGIDPNGQAVTDPNAKGYGAIGQYETNLQNAYNQEQQAWVDQYNQAMANAAAQKGQSSLYGVDPTSYIKQSAPLTLNNTISADQLSYIRALQKLAGVSDAYGAINPQAASGQGYTTVGDMNNDVNAAKASYQRSYSDVYNSAPNWNGTSANILKPTGNSDIDPYISPTGNVAQDLANLNHVKQVLQSYSDQWNDPSKNSLHNRPNPEPANIAAVQGVIDKLTALAQQYNQPMDLPKVTIGRGPMIRPR